MSETPAGVAWKGWLRREFWESVLLVIAAGSAATLVVLQITSTSVGVLLGAAAALLSLLFGLLITSGSLRARRRAAQLDRYIEARASREVAQRVGAERTLDLAIDETIGEANITDPVLIPYQTPKVEDEITRRVDEALERLQALTAQLAAQRDRNQDFESRVRAVEEKFPETTELQKYADANQLFLAYQLGEFAKRLDRLEDKQLSRPQVAGILLGTFVSVLGFVGLVVGILKALSVIH